MNKHFLRNSQLLESLGKSIRGEAKAKVKKLVPVLNLEHNYNKGYFRKELKQMKENDYVVKIKRSLLTRLLNK